MIFFIILLILFSCFSLPAKTSDEIINTKLLSETEPTDEEIINYNLDLIKSNHSHKALSSAYLDLFYGTDLAKTKIGSLYYGDLSVTHDAILDDNLYEFELFASTMTFNEDSIYLVTNFTDGAKGYQVSLTFFENFNAAYGIHGQDYFRFVSYNCDDFGDGDFEYGDYPLATQNILRTMNQRLRSTFEANAFEEEAIILFPKETFTVNKVANPDLSKTYAKYKFYGSDDPNRKKFNYDDYGFKFYEYNRIESDLFISFNNPTFIVNADNLVSFDSIKSQITATDFTEGDVTSKIEFKNNTYIIVDGKIKPGNYSFVAEVVDTAGNKASKKFNIVVKDITAPSVTVNDINLEYYESITKEELKNYFSVTDNCDSKNEITISITKDDYFNAHKHGDYNAALGTYSTTLRYTDKSGNSVDKSFNIIVEDNVKPVISVKTPIVSRTTEPLSIDDIKGYVTALDEYAGILNVNIDNLDSYGTSKEIKEYNFRASASDGKNEGEAYFTVSLVDKDIPEINYNTSYLIVVDETDKLSKDMILNLLKNDVNLTNFKVLSIESDYLTTAEIESGSYDVLINGIDLITQEERTIKAEIRVPKTIKEEIIKDKENKNITDFIKDNSLFFYTMAFITVISLIILLVILVKNVKKRKKDI